MKFKKYQSETTSRIKEDTFTYYWTDPEDITSSECTIVQYPEEECLIDGGLINDIQDYEKDAIFIIKQKNGNIIEVFNHELLNLDGFFYKNLFITNPYKDERMEKDVDPWSYYEDLYNEWVVDKGEIKLNNQLKEANVDLQVSIIETSELDENGNAMFEAYFEDEDFNTYQEDLATGRYSDPLSVVEELHESMEKVIEIRLSENNLSF